MYYAELDNLVEGLNSVEIQDIVDHIKDRYCHIDQADLDKNLERFNQGIDPSVPLIVYIRKQEDFQEFANDGNVNISKATMVTTGTKHAIQCGAFTDAWKEWNRIPCANQTWLAWKTHWTRAFKEQKTIQRLTGGEFSANSSIQTTNDELMLQMVTSLDNLAFAAVQKNETVEKLIEMNAQKDKTIAALTSNLTAEKAMVHIKPNRRQTWGYHAIRSWYFAQARHHYRCIQVVTDAGAVRVSDTFQFLHHNLPNLAITHTDRITKATQHLIRTIDGHPDAPDDELQAIQNLRDLLTGATTSHKDTTPTTEPISIFHEEAPPSLAPTLTHLVSPNPLNHSIHLHLRGCQINQM
eukprot:CCRYP_000317-RA/>CCRYP_000317-RA protein AED:0.29 eAED:-0.50 QI:0/-1/0/1/-1/0/1/0/351